MIAGGPDDPIHFTNILFDGRLYTLTYKWPDTVPGRVDRHARVLRCPGR